MFNLLRRRVRRKNNNNKNKYNIDAGTSDNVPKYSANKHRNDESKSRAIATYEHNVEHYRQFLENDEQFASGLATDAVATANVEASITKTKEKIITKTTRTNEIETIREFEGTAGLENYLQANDGKSRKTSAINAGKIYFENAEKKSSEFLLKKLQNNEQGNLSQTSDNFANRNLARLNVDDDHEEILEAEIEKVYRKNVEKNEGEQEQRLCQHRRKKVEDMSSDRLACGFSQNELSERQQHILTIGENDKILLDRKTINPSNNKKAFKLINNFRKTTTANLTSSHQTEDVNNDIEKICNKQTNSTTSSGQNPTIFKEVKYRNTDKTSRNEDKRQSRLSFTLAGINFGKKKVIENSENSLKNQETIEPVLHNQIQSISSESKEKCNDKLGPFEKSRKYLNNLFMARGRHHNRNQRHHQQHLNKPQVSKNVTPTGSSGSGNIAIDKKQQVNQLNSNKISSNLNSNNEVETIISSHLNNSVSSNAYRTPSPKNSMQNLQTETKININRERVLLRSNSATRVREQSLSPQLSKKRSRSVTFSDHEYIIEDTRDTWLDSYNEKFSRSANIERYGGKSLDKTANENFAQDNNNEEEHTHGAVSEERADSATATTSTTTSVAPTITKEFAYKGIDQQTNESFTQSNKNNNNNLGNKSEEKDQHNKFNKIGIESNASTPTPTPTPTPILITSINRTNIMGQTNTKVEPAAREFRESSLPPTTPTDRVKKVSFADIPVEASTPINIKLPSITVADYSGTLNSQTGTPSEQEVFYDLEYNDRLNDRINIMSVDDDVNDSVFYGGAATSTSMNDQHSKWQTPNNSAALSQSQMRHNYVKLEDVREEDEEESDDNENNADGEDSEEEEDQVKQRPVTVEDEAEEEGEEEEEEEESEEETSDVDDRHKRPRHLDNELYNSVERSPLKSSDTTLSGSPSDSGIGTDSQSTTPLNVKSRNSPTSFNTTTAAQHQQLRQQLKQQYGFMSFVRDGNSTDCDETLLPCDEIELDLADDENPNERLVCIESISLPDVVVESTTASSSATLSSASSTNSGEHIININGASGNVMGNVHFIPIHIEGVSNNSSGGAEGGVKRRSVDDSAIGNNTIEITEDACLLNGYLQDNRQTDKLK